MTKINFAQDALEQQLDQPVLSIVIPAFNESANLSRLVDSIRETVNQIPVDWELILVDDGSADDTWQTINELHAIDSRVRGLQLSRNFGHQYALLAGLTAATGQAVISMDADLQHPPEVIPHLLDAWRGGYKIVNTIRLDPADLPPWKKISSRAFYHLFSYLAHVNLSPGMADFRLIDRRALDKILSLSEDQFFLRGIVEWVGFPVTRVSFVCSPRFAGKTKYTLRKMLRLAINGVTGFSMVPLRIALVAGLFASAIGVWQMADAIYTKVILKQAVDGWASTMTVMSFMFAMLFIILGIIGEYIGQILKQSRGRPRFIIQASIGIIDERLTDKAVGRR